MALFDAVAAQEQVLLTMAVNAAIASEDEMGPVKALVAGGDAFLGAMQDPGRRQILLVDTPRPYWGGPGWMRWRASMACACWWRARAQR